MKKIFSATGHAVASLGTTAFGIVLAAAQSGTVTGKAGLVLAIIGAVYQARSQALVASAPAASPAVNTPVAQVPAAPVIVVPASSTTA